MTDPINRLPDPAHIDQFLRDRASMQKLKKAVRQSLSLMTPLASGKVAADFLKISGGQTADAFLTKGDSGGPAPTADEKRLLSALIVAIGAGGTPGLTTHSGFEDARALNDDESKKIAAVLDRVRTLVSEIADKNLHDSSVENVFGKARAADAKARFKEGLNALNRLVKSGGVVIDRMDKNKVWGCGGLTCESKMALPDGKLDGGEDAIIATLVHEMTHAMPPNLKTGDRYYRNSTEFPLAQPETKITTADYYAEVMARVLAKDPGAPFVPKDTSDKSNTPDKVLSLFRDEAGRLVRTAWVTAINLHDSLALWGGNAEKRQSWDSTPQFLKNTVLDDTKLNFAKNASRVMGLTIHKRAVLSGTVNEISRLDLSIMDNKINVLAQLLGCIEKVLTLPVDQLVFEEAKVDHVLRVALISLNHDRERPGLLAKDVDKDIVVIRSLSELNDAPNWTNYKATLAAGLPGPMKRYGETVH